ncbi:MAG: hypothetical protein ACUVR4_10530 [Anaerolineae bacterium]
MYSDDYPRAPALADRLTVEWVSYGGIALVALGVRLWGLGAVPLGPAEATQALPAVAAAAGQVPDLMGVSPLLYTLQRAAFMLFGATDASARWWPAFLTGLSPLLFYALRSRLTRGGALVAASLWALSPLAVWSSRMAVGDALVPALALAVLAALVWAWDVGPSKRVLTAGAVALGLLLASGSLAYTGLLALAVALLWWPTAARRLAAEVRAQRRTALAGLLAASVLGSTFFMITPAGLASAFEFFGRWLTDLAPGTGAYTPWALLRRLLLSEPLLLGFGLAGLIGSLQRGDRTGRWAGIAAGLALAIVLIGRGREPADLALVALWLTLLAGPAMARVLRTVWSWRRETDPWLLVSVSLALLFSALLSLPGAVLPTNTAAWRQVYAGIGIATVSVTLIMWLAYGAYGNWRMIGQTLPVVPLVLGLAWSLGQMTALSYDRGAWRQSAITHETVAPAAADFREALSQLSAFQGGSAREAAIDLIWPNRPDDPLFPVVRWLLRDYPYLRISASVPIDPAPLVVTPAEEQPRLGERYTGAEFVLLRRWQPEGLAGFNAILRWVLYREAKTPPEPLSVLLWVDRTTK